MLVHSIVLFCFLAAASARPGEVNRTNVDKRIVGGIDARRYEFPFLVSYQTIPGVHFCGGTILTKDWVLTAAHCMIKQPYETKVVAGLLDQGEYHPDMQVVGVSQQIIHPNYPGGAEAAPNDIGLLRLSWSLSWSVAVQPIYLPREGEESSGFAWTAGWGYLSSSQPVTPTRLQQVQLKLLTLSECARDFIEIVGSYGPLDANMVCGRGAFSGTESICRGDSGGPLLQGSKVIGVASWSLEVCGVYGVPSVFTKVSNFIRFIRYYVPDALEM